MISTSPAKSSPVKDVIIDAPAEEDSDAKASDDIGADFEVISASEAKDAPDEEEEESEAESEEAEEEGDEEEGEAEDEEEEAEEDDSAQKYASAREQELLKSA
jgi:exosome complex component RRP41